MSASLFYEKVKRQDVSARWTCEDGQAYSVRTVILFYYNLVQPYAVKTIKQTKQNVSISDETRTIYSFLSRVH